VNQDRDGWAMTLLTRLVARSTDSLESVFNVANAKDLNEQPVRWHMCRGDLILNTTRLAMNDHDERHVIELRSGLEEIHGKPQKRVPRGDNWLEEQILKGWRRYLRHCCRKCVALTKEGALALKPGSARKDVVTFRDNDDASVIRPHGGRRRTAGYIIYTKELWDQGPGCLSLFGMSGPVTFGLASAIHGLCPEKLVRGGVAGGDLVFEDSELILIEISRSGRGGANLTPSCDQGFPDFWKTWTLDWHRRSH
jgi:hypothetical protein